MGLLGWITGVLCTIVTFTIESKSSVSVSGVLPDAVHVEYSNTYKKGQLTAGNTAVLQITGWQDVEINAVRIWMHSNKSDGAGSLQMMTDGVSSWQIQDRGFDSDEWAGAYSQEWVAVEKKFSPAAQLVNGNLSIRIDATVNSLYLDRYEIDYTRAAKRAYTVQLHSSVGNCPASLTESHVGSGVVLPNIDWIRDTWGFVGWCEQDVASATVRPALLEPGKIYYPQRDGVLYAVFSNQCGAANSILSTTTLTDERYMMGLEPLKSIVSATGFPPVLTLMGDNMSAAIDAQSDSVWQLMTQPLNPLLVTMDKTSDSTAYLWVESTNNTIGCAQGKLADCATEWILRRRGCGFTVLTHQETETYYLTYELKLNGDAQDEPRLTVSKERHSTILFFPAAGQRGILYSTQPMQYIEALDEVENHTRAAKILRNGQMLIQYGDGWMDVMGRRR